MSEKLTLTSRAAQLLMSAASSITWPAKLGTGDYGLVFNDQERASTMQRIADLRATLRKYSHKRDGQYCIGAFANWRPKATEPGRFEMIDPEVCLEMEFGLGYWGIYFLLLWMAHPASPAFQKGDIQDEVIYPLIDLLGERDQLEYDLGLCEDKKDSIVARQTLTSTHQPAEKQGNGSH